MRRTAPRRWRNPPAWSDFDEVERAVETPIYSHEGLPAGVTIEGPAIVEQLDSTTVIPPGVRAEVDEWLNIRIHVAEA